MGGNIIQIVCLSDDRSLWDIEFWKYYTKSKYMLNSTYIMPHHDMGNIKDVCSYKIINSLDDISTNPY